MDSYVARFVDTGEPVTIRAGGQSRLVLTLPGGREVEVEYVPGLDGPELGQHVEGSWSPASQVNQTAALNADGADREEIDPEPVGRDKAGREVWP